MSFFLCLSTNEVPFFWWGVDKHTFLFCDENRLARQDLFRGTIDDDDDEKLLSKFHRRTIGFELQQRLFCRVLQLFEFESFPCVFLPCVLPYHHHYYYFFISPFPAYTSEMHIWHIVVPL